MSTEYLQSTLFLSPVQQRDIANLYADYSPNLEYNSIDTKIFKNLFSNEEEKNKEKDAKASIKLTKLIHLDKINNIKSIIQNEFESLFEDNEDM